MAKQGTKSKRKPGRPRTANPRRNRITSSYTDAELKVLKVAANGDLPGFIRDAALFRANTLFRAYLAAK